jgi:hypothetical protein
MYAPLVKQVPKSIPSFMASASAAFAGDDEGSLAVAPGALLFEI